MHEWVRLRKKQDMSVIQTLLNGMDGRDSEGYIIDFCAKNVLPGSERDTLRFKEILTAHDIPFGLKAIKMDEEEK